MASRSENGKMEVARQDLTALLLTGFSQLIASGEVKPGDRLPPERELARRFGTSRSSLRPMMKVLESVGVIHQRAGDGSYLNRDARHILNLPLTFLILLDSVSLIELYDARLMIEPELAARAAEAASSEDLAAMRETFDLMLIDTVTAGINFHELVCKATRNRICHRMFGAIHRAFRQSIEMTTRLAPSLLALEFHKEIYSAIHLRRPDEARMRMTEHLLDARGLLLQVHLEGEKQAETGQDRMPKI